MKTQEEYFDTPLSEWSLPVRALNKVGEVIVGKSMRIMFRVKVEGLDVMDRLPEGRPVMVAGNHTSYTDPMLVYEVLWPKRIRYMSKQGLIENHRILSWFLAWFGVFPVYHDTRARKSVKRAVTMLKRGEMVGIFPEGRRVLEDDKSNVELQNGVALIAKMADAIIVPVGIDGADRICPHKSHIPHFPKITLRFGEPVDYRDWPELRKNDLFDAVTNETMRRVYCLRDGIEPGPTPESSHEVHSEDGSGRRKPQGDAAEKVPDAASDEVEPGTERVSGAVETSADPAGAASAAGR